MFGLPVPALSCIAWKVRVAKSHSISGGVSEGGIETLSLPRAKPVEGNREVVYAHLRHRETSPELHSRTLTRVRAHCPLCSL